MRARSTVCAALLVTGIAAPVTAPSAFADAPMIRKSVAFSGSFDDGGGTCDGFGVTATFSGERTYIDFYAADGTLAKEIRQITFTGTLTNDITGASVPYSGRFVRTYDAASNTIVITGLSDRVGGVVVTTGRSLIDLDTGGGTETGKDQYGAVVCGALS